jgi:Zn-finger nucleic acid-binding protein
MAHVKCPVCDVPLSISSREGVEIDFCPQCRGVWLDRGELDKIIDRASPSGGSIPPDVSARGDYDRRGDERRYEPRRDDDDRGYRKKKKGSFLENIFDFD